jgi:hypothetical protein
MPVVVSLKPTRGKDLTEDDHPLERITASNEPYGIQVGFNSG